MIKELLKPKSKEDVLESLKRFNLPSYRLSSYLILSQYDVELKKDLRYFCLSYGLDVKKMEVTMPFTGIEFIFCSIFENFKKSVIKTSDNDNIIEYIPELQFIGYYKNIQNRFEHPRSNGPKRFYGFCFPKNSLHKILMTVTANQIKL